MLRFVYVSGKKFEIVLPVRKLHTRGSVTELLCSQRQYEQQQHEIKEIEAAVTEQEKVNELTKLAEAEDARITLEKEAEIARRNSSRQADADKLSTTVRKLYKHIRDAKQLQVATAKCDAFMSAIRSVKKQGTRSIEIAEKVKKPTTRSTTAAMHTETQEQGEACVGSSPKAKEAQDPDKLVTSQGKTGQRKQQEIEGKGAVASLMRKVTHTTAAAEAATSVIHQQRSITPPPLPSPKRARQQTSPASAKSQKSEVVSQNIIQPFTCPMPKTPLPASPHRKRERRQSSKGTPKSERSQVQHSMTEAVTSPMRKVRDTTASQISDRKRKVTDTNTPPPSSPVEKRHREQQSSRSNSTPAVKHQMGNKSKDSVKKRASSCDLPYRRTERQMALDQLRDEKIKKEKEKKEATDKEKEAIAERKRNNAEVKEKESMAAELVRRAEETFGEKLHQWNDDTLTWMHTTATLLLRPRFQCPNKECDQLFTTQNAMLDHVDKRHKFLIFTCSICDKSFSRGPTCMQHTRCHQRQTVRVIIQEELGTFQPQPPPIPSVSGTPQKKETQNMTSLRKRPHSKRSPCEEGQGSASTSNQKSVTHSSSSSQTNNKAKRKPGQHGKGAKSASSGKASATKQGKLKCDECEKVYTFASDLEIHKRCHSEERPHVCPRRNCDRAYKHKSELTKHMASHKKTLRRCPLEKCPFETRDSDEYRYHVTEFHASDARYKCNECNFTCKHRGSMDYHKKNSHKK